MSGVHWQYVGYTFDGDEKSVALIGDFPQGVSVKKYNDAAAIDAGDYTATAIFDYDTVNHNAPVVSPLDWSIAKARITGVELVGATVEYDSKPHSLRITGNLHSSVNIVYYYDGVIAESVTEVGRHEVKCVLSGKNHVTEELNAVLTIKATEELLFCAALDGTVCFQNSLDGNKLYKSTATGVKKIRIHDIRHSHASLLINQGCDALILADRPGHEKVSTTLNTYSHLFPHKQQSLVESLESLGAATQPAPEPPDGDLSLITLSGIDDIPDTIPTPAMLPEKEKAPGKVIPMPIRKVM